MDEEKKTNDWYQKYIFKGLKDLKEGLEKNEKNQKERYEKLEKKIEDLPVHSSPCTDLESLKTEFYTSGKVIKFFVAPLIIIVMGGIFALLFELLKKGGT